MRPFPHLAPEGWNEELEDFLGELEGSGPPEDCGGELEGTEAPEDLELDLLHCAEQEGSERVL